MIAQLFQNIFLNQKIGILGFGREGLSTYKTLRKYLPNATICILDQSELTDEKHKTILNDSNVNLVLGKSYLERLGESDVIIKSPGIPAMVLEDLGYQGNIYSQADLFLKLFRDQVVGITGTKGKSTTASLLHHILISAGRKSILAGNIGIPPFEIINEVTPETIVVLEMSSHQLENCTVSPHVSVLLNLFEEHLDHYRSFFDYQLAKANIFKYQADNDYVIADFSNSEVARLLDHIAPVSNIIDIGNTGFINNESHFIDDDIAINIEGKTTYIEGLARLSKIPGNHNLKNVSAATTAAVLLGLDNDLVAQGVSSFKGLPHRLEYVGEARGIHFYNDSISTIPQATVEALKAFPETSTLIVGGHDRGIDYSGLAAFLPNSNIDTVVFLGKAGKRMYDEVKKIPSLEIVKTFLPKSFEEGFEMALNNTIDGRVCILSPAASSYDEFKNFEHRGEVFRKLVEKYSRI